MTIKLVGGNIPAHTVCPFREQCEIAQGGHCKHKGVDHPCEFSCAVARAFELVSKYEGRK